MQRKYTLKYCRMILRMLLFNSNGIYYFLMCPKDRRLSAFLKAKAILLATALHETSSRSAPQVNMMFNCSRNFNLFCRMFCFITSWKPAGLTLSFSFSSSSDFLLPRAYQRYNARAKGTQFLRNSFLLATSRCCM